MKSESCGGSDGNRWHFFEPKKPGRREKRKEILKTRKKGNKSDKNQDSTTIFFFGALCDVEMERKCIQVTQSKRNEIRNQIKMIEKTFWEMKDGEWKEMKALFFSRHSSDRQIGFQVPLLSEIFRSILTRCLQHRVWKRTWSNRNFNVAENGRKKQKWAI